MSEWTSPAQPVRCVVELDKPLAVHRERGVLAQGDENANAIVAEVYSTAGKPYDLSGCTVQLIFVRPDNNALPAINAEINGNTATATLTGSAYAMSGMYSLRMQLRKNGAERTIVWIIGEVKGTDVDGIADHEHVISIGDIMASAKEAQTAASAAKTAAERANAGAERVEQLQIDASGLAGDSNKLGGKAPEYYLPVANLFINPDFAIAQAGYGGKHGDDTYAADSWLGRNAASTVYAALENGGIKIIGGQWACKLQQKLAAKSLRGKKITAGLKLKSSVGRAWATLMALDANRNELANSTKTIACPMETVFAFSIVVPESAEYVVFTFDNNMAETATIEINWTALYEGEYTAETLPPFVPPDHVNELLKCQRYYYKIPAYFPIGAGYVVNTDTARILLNLPVKMQANPSLPVDSSIVLVQNGGGKILTDIGAEVINNGVRLTLTTTGLSSGYPCFAHLTERALELIADL